MSLRNDIMRFSVLGFRSVLRIELQAPVVYVHLAVEKGNKFLNNLLLRVFFDDYCH